MKKIIIMLMALLPMAAMAQNVKFGHIDTQSLMQHMPEFIKARGELEAEQKQYENELQEMQKELQTKAEKYEKEKATMNATMQQSTEQSLQEMYTKIQQAYQDNQQKIQKASQEKLQPISTKLQNAIQAVGKAGGYVYIMDIAAGIPYISEALSKDVSSEVKAELNKMK
ncbi:MAG: OmpH family outer membrane protein [Bacteroidales bacterium]|nr:OmpH family outer membrane protein [Bacteroidales bacterium]MCM1146941.1 OmpH family outer membrane protein [Bacteroidales bacterium]MCM1207012.1 OmpH family outer membrane protein [Bacillota bacterium]MCM1511434.1 OmpH family outer membrane protein [Clostridium sp.]